MSHDYVPMIQILTQFDRALKQVSQETRQAQERAAGRRYDQACLAAERDGKSYPAPPRTERSRSVFLDQARAKGFPRYVEDQINVRGIPFAARRNEGEKVVTLDASILARLPPIAHIVRAWPYAFIDESTCTVDIKSFPDPTFKPLGNAESLFNIAQRSRFAQGYVWVWPKASIPTKQEVLRYLPDPLGRKTSTQEKPRARRTSQQKQEDVDTAVRLITSEVLDGKSKLTKLRPAFERLESQYQIPTNNEFRREVRLKVEDRLREIRAL